jgi:ketopantoate hydroxymethyltransferase
MRYLDPIYFCYMRFGIGASSVVVSRLRTHGAAVKLRASCECTHMIVLLVDAGIKVSGHDPLWNCIDV